MRRVLALTLFAWMAATGSASAANIVINPGFETGDFTGWLPGGNLNFAGVDNLVPHSGTFAAFFGGVIAPATLTQQLNTSPSETYNLSFWLMNEPGEPNFFSVSWNGIELATLVDAAPFDYMQLTFTGLTPSSGSQTPLVFTFMHGPAFWDLDDVVVEARTVVPEPATLLLAGIAAVVLRGRRRLLRLP